MKVKITKITHRASSPNNEGLWLVWCQVYVNGKYKYTVLDFASYEDAMSLQEGQMVDVNFPI